LEITIEIIYNLVVCTASAFCLKVNLVVDELGAIWLYGCHHCLVGLKAIDSIHQGSVQVEFFVHILLTKRIEL
jgi:hypothetical protein